MAASLEDASVEKEFLNFVARLRSRHTNHGVSYQMNNYPEGIECTFRIARTVVGSSENSFASNLSRVNFGENSVKDEGKTEFAPPQSYNSVTDKYEGLSEKEKEIMEAKRAKKVEKRKAKRQQYKEKIKMKKMELAGMVGENGDAHKTGENDSVSYSVEDMKL